MKKTGFSALFIIVFTFIASAAILLQRQNIYSGYQQVGFNFGHNFNEISTQNYVNFINSQSGQKENNNSGTYLNKKIAVVDSSQTALNVLGTNPPDDNKWIEVDISEQRLNLKVGDRTEHTFLVSTGKWTPTPQGEWRIWTKLRYARMRGGSRALGTFYDLPNVPYTMYYNQGYGIHGAYWHNNFGTPMSHGCVNMKPEEAGIVFNWASVGTRVAVHS